MAIKRATISNIPNLWEMYEKTYAPFGLQYKNLDELKKEDFVWESVDDLAFAAYKKTNFGLKGVLMASDCSIRGKKSCMEIIQGFNRSGYYCEFCGKPERIAEHFKVNKVVNSIAAKILNKPIIFGHNEFEYSRHITNIGLVRKVMFGKPII